MLLIATAVPWVFGRSRISRLLRRGVLTLGAAGLAWVFLRRRSRP